MIFLFLPCAKKLQVHTTYFHYESITKRTPIHKYLNPKTALNHQNQRQISVEIQTPKQNNL